MSAAKVCRQGARAFNNTMPSRVQREGGWTNDVINNHPHELKKRQGRRISYIKQTTGGVLKHTGRIVYYSFFIRRSGYCMIGIIVHSGSHRSYRGRLASSRLMGRNGIDSLPGYIGEINGPRSLPLSRMLNCAWRPLRLMGYMFLIGLEWYITSF